MKVYMLFDSWDNEDEYEDHDYGDQFLDVFDSLEKALQAARDFKPELCILDEDLGDIRYIKETIPALDFVKDTYWGVRKVEESVDKFNRYMHELYIVEREVK